MNWKSDKGKTSFQAVLGWFSPIIAILGCTLQFTVICKCLVYRIVLKFRDMKMARKNVRFSSPFS